MTRGVYFLAAALALVVALAAFLLISFGNGLSKQLNHLTKKLGPGVIHPDKPAPYTLVYMFILLAVGLIVGGFYH